MLVYVDPARLSALRGDPAATWTLSRGALVDRELLREPDWNLYLATGDATRARAIAYLEHVATDGDELGDATACDVDITPLLERLGCTGGAAAFAAWARRPRILTRADADLLRYRLGLPLDVAPPPPLPPPAPAPALPFPDDAVALDLLAAVHADLASDANRMVLADRLLELGDPRGELVALQLARARTGALPTQRERELLSLYGRAWIGPLAPHLVRHGFHRGFLATAVVDGRAPVPPPLRDHPLWATVEDLETEDPELLLAPALRSLRRIAVTAEVLEGIVQEGRPLAVETVVGASIPLRGRVVQGGLALPPSDLQPLVSARALERVRAMSLSADTPALADRAADLLRTKLGARLEHVELFARSLAAADVRPWRHAYDRNRPLSLGLRSVIDDWLVLVVRQRGALVVQLGAPTAPRAPSLFPIAPAIARLGEGLTAVRLERVGEEGGAIDLHLAVEELRRVFPSVELAAANRWRSP